MKLHRMIVLVLSIWAIVAVPLALDHLRATAAEPIITNKTSTSEKTEDEKYRLKIERLAAFPPSGIETTFTPAIVQNPKKICTSISADDGSTVWAESKVKKGEWECLSQQFADFSAGYSIFAIARGPNQNHLKSVRMKLTISDPTQRELSIQQFYKTIESLFEAAKLDLSIDMRSVPPVQKPLSDTQNGFEIKFFRERSEEERYNLILSWPSRYIDTIPGSSERFGPSGFKQ